MRWAPWITISDHYEELSEGDGTCLERLVHLTLNPWARGYYVVSRGGIGSDVWELFGYGARQIKGSFLGISWQNIQKCFAYIMHLYDSCQ